MVALAVASQASRDDWRSEGCAHTGELVDYGLLLCSENSYQISHALAHSHTRTQARPGAGVINRVARYYAAVAQTESAKGLAGYITLDKQRAHILAVQAARSMQDNGGRCSKSRGRLKIILKYEHSGPNASLSSKLVLMLPAPLATAMAKVGS